MGMGGPGMGMGSPDAMLSQVENKKREVVSQLDRQKSETVTRTEKSFAAQVKEYSGRREGIVKGIMDLRRRMEQMPNVPQAKEAKGKLAKQLDQMRQALAHINQALSLMSMQKNEQLRKISGQIEIKKREVAISFKEQKTNILLRFAGQKAQMQKQMMAMRMKSPEGGKPKG